MNGLLEDLSFSGIYQKDEKEVKTKQYSGQKTLDAGPRSKFNEQIIGPVQWILRLTSMWNGQNFCGVNHGKYSVVAKDVKELLQREKLLQKEGGEALPMETWMSSAEDLDVSSHSS